MKKINYIRVTDEGGLGVSQEVDDNGNISTIKYTIDKDGQVNYLTGKPKAKELPKTKVDKVDNIIKVIEEYNQSYKQERENLMSLYNQRKELYACLDCECTRECRDELISAIEVTSNVVDVISQMLNEIKSIK